MKENTGGLDEFRKNVPETYRAEPLPNEETLEREFNEALKAQAAWEADQESAGVKREPGKHQQRLEAELEKLRAGIKEDEARTEYDKRLLAELEEGLDETVINNDGSALDPLYREALKRASMPVRERGNDVNYLMDRIRARRLEGQPIQEWAEENGVTHYESGYTAEPPPGSALGQGTFTLYSVPDSVFRDAHVMRTVRTLLRENYLDVVNLLDKDKSLEWAVPLNGFQSRKDIDALSYFVELTLNSWTAQYGETVLDVTGASVESIASALEETLTEWAIATGFSLKDRGPAIYPRELAPYLSTSKIARRFHELDEQETEFIGGRSQQLQHRRFTSAITAPDATRALELSQTHVVVSDAIGSLYHSHREETGELHARFTLSQITQQVMGNTKPTAPQQREVKASIEFLRRHIIHTHGEIVTGERVDYDDFLLSASATSVTNRMGNSVTGYKVRDYPVVFDISRRQEQARQLDALLHPRPDGDWWPSRLEEMTVYHMVCRLLFTLTPGKDGYSIVEDKELQQGLGGKYAPEHITARGKRTVREYREAAVKELQARGFIATYDDYKPSRSVLGARIKISSKFPALKISPDDKRRIERT